MTSRFALTHINFGTTHAADILRNAARLAARVHAVHVGRRELAELEPRLLADIGVSPRQALTESGRAPWDIRPTALHRRGGGNGGKPADWRGTLRMAFRRWRTRQRISQLDQHSLRDIGVTYAEAEREANKAFWQR
jgi:uncharacterized protein YjiS (DUF1127 family)